MIIVPENQID